MRQALQIFVGWLTAACRCQAPAAETTKRRIRLALEPQIPHPSTPPPPIPPSLHPRLSFLPPPLLSIAGAVFSSIWVRRIWQRSNSNSSIWSVWKGGGGHLTWRQAFTSTIECFQFVRFPYLPPLSGGFWAALPLRHNAERSFLHEASSPRSSRNLTNAEISV